MRFKKGDIVISQQNIEREIVKVYKNFYKWKYLDNETIFESRNSNDPTFYWGKLKQ